jgi:hypothetical protein
MIDFLRGATAMGCAIAGLLFLRFWRRSFDRLFLFFALAFLLMACDYTALGLLSLATEWRPYVYGLRLTAFALIALAIVDKNVRSA